MAMSEKIERGLVVAGVDGSAPSVAALHWAARYAAATGAAVRAVLACHEPTTAGQRPVGALPADVRQETETRLRQVLHDAVVEAFGGQPGGSVETRFCYGHPAEVLIDESKQADLLVVGSRGHGAFTGMLIGSVSIHCVTGAFCPVTVVREDAAVTEATR
jgi:nucleotide-binding universal stress UspA family protein